MEFFVKRILEEINMRLEKIERSLVIIAGSEYYSAKREENILADLTDLTSKVAATETAEQSAIVLLNNLAQMIRDAGIDPAALADLATRLDTGANDLAAAVVADTPAAPAPAPAPAPVDTPPTA